MTEQIEKVLARVRKMMNLANNSAASEGERDNALRMAHAYLAKHTLDMSAIEQTTGADEDRCDVTLQQRSRPWIRTVANGIADMMFCKHFYSKSGNNDTHYFIGRKDNVAVAQYMLDYLVKSMRSEARARFGDVAAARTAFQKGAVLSVWQRCQQLKADAMRNDAPEAAPGTALVLASIYASEAEKNAKYLAEQMKINLKQTKNRERDTGHAGAFFQGRDYGNTVSLNRQLG